MKNITINIIIAIALVDLIGYLLWQLSGQTPPDAFHAGMITEYITNLIK